MDQQALTWAPKVAVGAGGILGRGGGEARPQGVVRESAVVGGLDAVVALVEAAVGVGLAGVARGGHREERAGARGVPDATDPEFVAVVADALIACEGGEVGAVELLEPAHEAFVDPEAGVEGVAVVLEVFFCGADGGADGGVTEESAGVVVEVGEEARREFLVKRGQMKVARLSLSGNEKVIEVVSPGYTFAEALRHFLRHDPDVIMVGEIRDEETAHIANKAALTGHLVFSTLHTNDSPSSLSRLLELGVPAYLIKATVRGVMSQRLVRILCPECKTFTDLDLDAWQQLTHPWNMEPPAQVARPVGCKACRDTGYRGRQGIYEVLVNTPEVEQLIVPHLEVAAVRAAAMKEGMMTLRMSGAARVARGETSIEEVMRVAPMVDS